MVTTTYAIVTNTNCFVTNAYPLVTKTYAIVTNTNCFVTNAYLFIATFMLSLPQLKQNLSIQVLTTAYSYFQVSSNIKENRLAT
ncbi:hypothetical protein [Nostoc sp.]|uniref:hypothetical protein n=1 Tax=Nostoc sp. TaxID=1180 RepID=UPI002FFCFA35